MLRGLLAWTANGLVRAQDEEGTDWRPLPSRGEAPQWLAVGHIRGNSYRNQSNLNTKRSEALTRVHV